MPRRMWNTINKGFKTKYCNACKKDKFCSMCSGELIEGHIFCNGLCGHKFCRKCLAKL